MRFILCKARHDHEEIKGLPSIFPQKVDDITNVGELTRIAREAIKDCTEVDLYVTGLTVALVAVIRVCYTEMIPLTLWHFNSDNNSYFPQIVITEQDAAFQKECGWYY